MIVAFNVSGRGLPFPADAGGAPKLLSVRR
jgi:hypothetical protein